MRRPEWQLRSTRGRRKIAILGKQCIEITLPNAAFRFRWSHPQHARNFSWRWTRPRRHFRRWRAAPVGPRPERALSLSLSQRTYAYYATLYRWLEQTLYMLLGSMDAGLRGSMDAISCYIQGIDGALPGLLQFCWRGEGVAAVLEQYTGRSGPAWRGLLVSRLFRREWRRGCVYLLLARASRSLQSRWGLHDDCVN